jgi:Domain of unknown function (DUF2470)
MNDPVRGGSWSPRAFLTHLNQRHPDTVLFLTRQLATDPGLFAAEFIDVDGDQLTVQVSGTGGSRNLKLPLEAPVRSRAELLTQLFSLLRAARANAPAEPLTSLEVDIGSRHSLPPQ